MEVKEVKGVSSLCSHQGKLKDNSFAVRFKAEKYTTSQWHRINFINFRNLSYLFNEYFLITLDIEATAGGT